MNTIKNSPVIEGLMNYETLDSFLNVNDLTTLQKALIDTIIHFAIKSKEPQLDYEFEELTKKNPHIIADLAVLYQGLSDSFTYIPEETTPKKQKK